ncbi:hypothetical protein E7V67_001985 [[Empedobacter] haloabium]|uniref:Uncharacterized protein n=1 Tax=[Empedobacter] haloabium TaxID=592317 RepID=A0ABZ1UMJ4_9BURK
MRHLGHDVRAEDLRIIARLIDEMPGMGGGAGKWHLTPVTHLR